MRIAKKMGLKQLTLWREALSTCISRRHGPDRFWFTCNWRNEVEEAEIFLDKEVGNSAIWFPIWRA
jgi:hypothetical protein